MGVELRPHQGKQIAGIGLIEDGEVGVEPEQPAMPPQHPVADGVEGATPDPPGDVVAGKGLGPAQEFGGRPTAEGEQQDPLGRRTALDEGRKTRCQRRGLAGAGTGDDQQMAPAVVDGRPLLIRERREHVFERTNRVGQAPGTRQDPHPMAADERLLTSVFIRITASALAYFVAIGVARAGVAALRRGTDCTAAARRSAWRSARSPCRPRCFDR